jgi:transposase InsO family protein
MIHQMLIHSGFIDASISVRAIQRFLKANDLKSARNPQVRDRKAYEMPEFGCMWQADTAYLPYITENGRSRRTFLIMIIDDHSRLIVGGGIFYNDNSYNYQKVLRQAIAAYGLPDKLYMDHGSSFENEQLTLILDSLGIVESHAPVRDGAAKGKVERNFRHFGAAGFLPWMFPRFIPLRNSTGFLLTTSAATTLPYTPVLERHLSIVSCALKTMSASPSPGSGWMNASQTGLPVR